MPRRKLFLQLKLKKGFLQQDEEIIWWVMNVKNIYGFDSAFGGQDFYDENGYYVGSSAPGIGGGEDYFGADGTTGYSVDSVLGNGKDFYFSDGRTAYTVDSILGGQTIHGDVNGFSMNSPFGGLDAVIDENS